MALPVWVSLSGSTQDRGIAVPAGPSPGVLIHTAHATARDEIYLEVVNIDTTTDYFLTIEFGGTGAADKILVKVKKNEGMRIAVAGRSLSNSLVVRAFADVANQLNIFGHVVRFA